MSDKWKERRNAIIRRDNSICQKCRNKTYLTNSLSTFRWRFPDNELLLHTHDEEILYCRTDRNEIDLKRTKRNLAIYDKNSNILLGFVSTDKNISHAELEEYKQSEILKQAQQAVDSKNSDPNRLEPFIIYLTSTYNTPPAIARSILLEQKIKMDTELNSLEWTALRNLHVHHKYYQENKLPWEYPDSALITLCWICHEKMHKDTKIPWLNECGETVGELGNCSRCSGAGYLPEYYYVQSGICFKCNGSRYEEFI